MKDEITEENCQSNLRALREKEEIMHDEIHKLRNEIHDNRLRIRSTELHLNAFSINNIKRRF